MRRLSSRASPDFAEMAADRRETGRRRRQIEQAVAVGLALALDAGELAADFFVGLRIVRVALHVGDAGRASFFTAAASILRVANCGRLFVEIGAERFAR